MKALVIYDSMYGNTEKIAQAIGAAISAAPGSQVETILVGNVKPEQVAGLDLLIVGAPTQRFRTIGIQPCVKGVNAILLPCFIANHESLNMDSVCIAAYINTQGEFIFFKQGFKLFAEVINLIVH